MTNLSDLFYRSILLLYVGMSTTKLLKLSVVFSMRPTLLAVLISRKKPSQRSKKPWISSTLTEKFFNIRVFVQRDFPFLVSILSLTILVSSKILVPRVGYAPLSLNRDILQPLKGHGDVQTTTKHWDKCSWQINVLISLQPLKLISLIEECYPLPLSDLKITPPLKQIEIWMIRMKMKIRIV